MSKDKEQPSIKEEHYHFHYHYPCYISQPLRYYPYPWHSITPPPVVAADWFYKPTITTTDYIK